ncbi:hypothetical protein V2J09_008712 [Rumex salicifolius]
MNYFPKGNVKHANPNPIPIEQPNIPKEKQEETIDDEELLSKQALLIARGISFPMTLKAAIELKILDLVSESHAYVSASELVDRIPGCMNPEAPVLLDRMLSLLTSFSILNCELRSNGNVGEEGGIERVYEAAPICKYFLTKNVGVHGSFGPLFLLHHDKVILDSWCNFKDALMEGGSTPFTRAHGMTSFEYARIDSRFNKVFNEAMSNHTTLITNKILDTYTGFEGINVLVDVGGGIGTTLDLITSKYPAIKGINFDLPHVLADSPIVNPRVNHVGGNMFEQVPHGDAIFMKWILHDWSDEKCMKLLNNCWKALPENGKVIMVESILSLTPQNNYESQIAVEQDVAMFVHNHGGKERTREEFGALATGSGFTGFHVICSVYNTWVIEFRKA